MSIVRELAIAKSEGIIKNEAYNIMLQKLVFKIDGKTMKVHMTENEYEEYLILIEIYRQRTSSLFL